MHRGQGVTKNTTKTPWYRQGNGLPVDTGREGADVRGKEAVRGREGPLLGSTPRG